MFGTTIQQQWAATFSKLTFVVPGDPQHQGEQSQPERWQVGGGIKASVHMDFRRLGIPVATEVEEAEPAGNR